MSANAIELAHMERTLGSFTLGPINLIVPKGALVALIGPNGAGKTTMLDLIMGLGRPDSGTIRVLDHAQPHDEVPIKRKTAYVNPDLNFQAWGTVGRALDFVRGFYPDWDQDRCDKLMAEFSVHRDEKIKALSFGARIKLALIMALSRDAELLLLDEPTVGLDVQARLTLFRELMEVMKREGRTIIISSHQLADLERIADHVAILKGGQLLSMGRLDTLLDRYSQLDAQITTGSAMPALDGIRVLERQDDRVRLLLDETVAKRADLAGHGIEILADVPMTLEELFVALTGV